MANKKKVELLTEAELKIVYEILQSTWSEIAYDCITVGEKSTMKRDEVIEVVLDADRPSRHVRTPEQKTAWAKYEGLGYEEMIKVAEGTFKHKLYGL